MTKPRAPVRYAKDSLREQLRIAADRIMELEAARLPRPVVSSFDEAMAMGKDFPPGTMIEIREPRRPTLWQRICNVWRRLLRRE